MKCFVTSEWWRLLLAAAWTGLAIWNAIEGRMGFALLCAVEGMYFAVSAPCEHLIRQLEREIDELRGQRLSALATALLLARPCPVLCSVRSRDAGRRRFLSGLSQ